jgi:hypothetical protein
MDFLDLFHSNARGQSPRACYFSSLPRALGSSDFRTLTGTRCRRHVLVTGICLDDTLRRHAQPVHSLGSLSLPRPLFTDHDPLPVQDSHTCLHDGAVKCGLGVRTQFSRLTQAHRAVPS